MEDLITRRNRVEYPIFKKSFMAGNNDKNRLVKWRKSFDEKRQVGVHCDMICEKSILPQSLDVRAPVLTQSANNIDVLSNGVGSCNDSVSANIKFVNENDDDSVTNDDSHFIIQSSAHHECDENSIGSSNNDNNDMNNNNNDNNNNNYYYNHNNVDDKMMENDGSHNNNDDNNNTNNDNNNDNDIITRNLINPTPGDLLIIKADAEFRINRKNLIERGRNLLSGMFYERIFPAATLQRDLKIENENENESKSTIASEDSRQNKELYVLMNVLENWKIPGKLSHKKIVQGEHRERQILSFLGGDTSISF